MDPKLITSAAQGDQAAFERLMVEMYGRLHRIAHGILREDHRAEDAVQHAVLTIWQQLRHLRDHLRRRRQRCGEGPHPARN